MIRAMEPRRSRPTIVVRPFANATGDTQQGFLCDGLAEDVAVELSRFRSLFDVVRADASAQAPAGGYSLAGVVRRLGERMRVRVDLIDEAGVELWAERYDRQVAGVFDAQEELARGIVATTAGRIVALGV